jgi:hypothetical protein
MPHHGSSERAIDGGWKSRARTVRGARIGGIVAARAIDPRLSRKNSAAPWIGPCGRPSAGSDHARTGVGVRRARVVAAFFAASALA